MKLPPAPLKLQRPPSAFTDLHELDAILDGATPIGDDDGFAQTRSTPQIDLRETNPAPFDLVPLGDLGPPVPVDWLWPGYIPRGGIVLLSAHPKAGKTTLLSHLIRDLYTGGGLVGNSIIDDPTILLSEEHADLWSRRRSDLGIDPDLVLLCKGMDRAKPGMVEWRRIVDHLVEQVKERGVALVVIDTLLSVLPVSDENSSAEMQTALQPLRAISDAGAAVLLIHHTRKGGGSEGTAARGSSVLAGFPDIIIELKRMNAEDEGDRRRRLTARGRYAHIPPDTVVAMDDDGLGFTVLGSMAQARDADIDATMESILPPHDGPGITGAELLAEWPEGSDPPGKRTVEGRLVHGAKAGRWEQLGGGKRGDPFRFRRLPDSFRAAQSLGAARLRETESAPDTTREGDR